jgi:hypothetical protein
MAAEGRANGFSREAAQQIAGSHAACQQQCSSISQRTPAASRRAAYRRRTRHLRMDFQISPLTEAGNSPMRVERRYNRNALRDGYHHDTA